MEKKIDTRKEVEIKLDFPVQLADRVLDKVTIRRPVMRDMIKRNIGDNMSVQDTVNFVADLCGLVPDEVEMLDTCDFEKLQNQLLAFRGALPPERGNAANRAAGSPIGI